MQRGYIRSHEQEWIENREECRVPLEGRNEEKEKYAKHLVFNWAKT
jgi:hypothetical protein